VVRAAREARPLLVGEAEGDERRLLELERHLRLAGIRLRGEVPVHAHDLERPLPEVVGLLDVQGQDLVGDLPLRHEEREHRPRPELLQRREAVASVRREVAIALPHRDDGVEVALRLVHRERQPAHVGVGHVALEGRALDLPDGKRREEERVAPERLPVRGEHRPPVRLHRPGELRHLGRRLREPQVPRLEGGGLELHAAPLAGAAGLRGGALLRGGHGRQCRRTPAAAAKPFAGRPGSAETLTRSAATGAQGPCGASHRYSRHSEAAAGRSPARSRTAAAPKRASGQEAAAAAEEPRLRPGAGGSGRCATGRSPAPGAARGPPGRSPRPSRASGRGPTGTRGSGGRRPRIRSSARGR